MQTHNEKNTNKDKPEVQGEKGEPEVSTICATVCSWKLSEVTVFGNSTTSANDCGTSAQHAGGHEPEREKEESL